MKIRRLLAAVIVVELLASGVALTLHTTGHPFSLDQALKRFREEGPPTAAAAPSLPASGVYVYDTEGSEQLDALGGAGYTYPSQTTVTVGPEGCGFRERWQPLSERYDERLRCPRADGSEALPSRVVHHEFFHVSDTRTFTCDAGSLIEPADRRATWSGRCRAPGIESSVVGAVVGVETLTVAGTPVPAVHVRIDDTVAGDSRGTATYDYWLAVRDGLLVRQHQLVDTENASPFGPVHYHEEFTLRLTSLQPRH